MLKKQSELSEILDQLKLIRDDVKNANYDLHILKMTLKSHDDQFRLIRNEMVTREDLANSEKKILAHIEQVRFDLQRYTGEASDSLIQTLEVMFPEKSFPKKTDVKIPIVN